MDALLASLVNRYPDLEVCAGSIQSAFEALQDTFRLGGKLLVCGNGGSAADSEHIVAELMKGYLLERRIPQADRERLLAVLPETGEYLADRLQGALPAISLVSQTALITAYANDMDPEMVFAQQVYGYGRPGDALLVISTSGSSKNVLLAAQVANAFGLRTIGLTGRNGGRLAALCHVTICVPGGNTPEIQERHLAVYHTLCAMLEAAFFEAQVENPAADNQNSTGGMGETVDEKDIRTH